MASRYRIVVVLCTMALAISGCQGSTSVAQKPTHRRRSDVTLTASDTATALAAPAQADKGAWSLLANLGIGVYTPGGQQVMPGSEMSVDDFWLYDFEVPSLAKMAGQQGGHVSDLARALTAWGFSVKGPQLVRLYRAMFASQKDSFTAELFRRWKVSFTGDPQLTRLQAWLLLVSLLPPAGAKTLVDDVTAGTGTGGAHPAAFVVPRAVTGSGPCANVKGGGGVPSNYAVASKYGNAVVDGAKGATLATLAERDNTIGLLAKFNDFLGKAAGAIGLIKDAATFAAIYGYFTLSVDVSPSSVHMVHDTQGQSLGDNKVTITATVKYEGPKKNGHIDCGQLAKLALPKPGPIKNAGIRFRVDDFLKQHGYVVYPSNQVQARLLTGSDGKVSIQYETKNERPRAAQKSKVTAKGQGVVTAEVDVAGAEGQFFNPFSSLEILFDLFDLSTITYPITVTWHVVAGKEIDLRHTYKSGEVVTGTAYTCNGTSWTGSLAVKGTIKGASVASSGKFKLTVDHGTGKTSVPTKGSFTASGHASPFTDNLMLMLTTSADNKTAQVTLGSVGDGRITLPVVGSGPFASLFPDETYGVTLKPHTCTS